MIVKFVFMQLHGRLYSIEGLRSILMLLIFLEHYPDSPIKLGGFAVCFFFMLSGFTLSYGYQDKILSGIIRYKDFIVGRVLKIYILHWLLLPIGFYIHRDTWMYTSKYVIANFLLLQSWIPNHYSYYSGNGVSWFLSTLLFCYIIYPYLIRKLSTLSIKANIVVCIFFFLLRIVLEHIISQNQVTNWLYISPFVRWLDFSIGILVYRFYQQLGKEEFNYNIGGRRYRMPLYWLFTLCLFALAFPFSKVCLWWVLFFIVINLLLHLEDHTSEIRFSNRIFNAISLFGKISFTFYLIHQVYILILYNHLPVNQINSEIVKFVTILLSCIIVSYVVYVYIEQPICRKLKSFLYSHL